MHLFSILNGRLGFAIYIVELKNCGASFKCRGCWVRMLNVYFLKSQFPNILRYLFVFNHVLVNNRRPISIAFVFHMFICCQSACRRPISKGIVENPSVQESWPRMELSSLVGECQGWDSKPWCWEIPRRGRRSSSEAKLGFILQNWECNQHMNIYTIDSGSDQNPRGKFILQL